METTRILGVIRDNGKENGNYYNIGGHRGYIRTMEKKMETTTISGVIGAIWG